MRILADQIAHIHLTNAKAAATVIERYFSSHANPQEQLFQTFITALDRRDAQAQSFIRRLEQIEARERTGSY